MGGGYDICEIGRLSSQKLVVALVSRRFLYRVISRVDCIHLKTWAQYLVIADLLEIDSWKHHGERGNHEHNNEANDKKRKHGQASSNDFLLHIRPRHGHYFQILAFVGSKLYDQWPLTHLLLEISGYLHLICFNFVGRPVTNPFGHVLQG